ncbi:MAG: class I SAM-dependent methyltransferase [Candidatus Taylorbacteria bacterium]|nr:class I SAM-dependent methyltransferase [Candidatus Taylorbacteria bacterium]
MNKSTDTVSVLSTGASADYELLDSGDGEKLERFGKVVLSRPDPQALWPKILTKEEWSKRNAFFAREKTRAGWTIVDGTLDRWAIDFGGLKMWIKPTAFKHTGLFPEQAVNWDWIRETIGAAKKADPAREIEVLNIFGYTGGASLAAAQAGAKVVHVDGSKAAITWARDNAEISGLKDAPIRWILEDARAFVEREVKRGRKYDAIIMDPPAFGHGPKKELWKIEEHFMQLLSLCEKLLDHNPLFILINGYSAGYSSIAYENNLLPYVQKFGGEIEKGELTLKESNSGRLLPCGIFARWRKI